MRSLEQRASEGYSTPHCFPRHPWNHGERRKAEEKRGFVLGWQKQLSLTLLNYSLHPLLVAYTVWPEEAFLYVSKGLQGNFPEIGGWIWALCQENPPNHLRQHSFFPRDQVVVFCPTCSVKSVFVHQYHVILHHFLLSHHLYCFSSITVPSVLHNFFYSRFIQHWGILTCREDKNVSRLSQPLLWTAAHSPGKPPLHGQTCCPRKTATPQNSITAAPAQEERTGYGCGTKTGYQSLFPILSVSQVFFMYSTGNTNLGQIIMHLEMFYHQWKCIKHLPHSDFFPILEHTFSDLPTSLLNRP